MLEPKVKKELKGEVGGVGKSFERMCRRLVVGVGVGAHVCLRN